MSFVSLEFGVLLVAVYSLYWLLHARTRAQNLLLLVASYIFYGWWDPRFLVLIIASSLLDFVVGRRLSLEDSQSRRRVWLGASLVLNLGMLAYFKYAGFFADNLVLLLEAVGLQAHRPTLNIVLPVGISFFTFQTLSYTIDVYRRKLAATEDLLAFMTFVAFFPQLVAGPIERAKVLLGQFERPRAFSEMQAKDGLRRMLWGFFKKVVVADSCAPLVDAAYNHPAEASGVALATATIFFAFQIYTDFSGYTDIAIGCAALFGVELSQNFATPYFSRNIVEFWRRWHISLSTWFRDYLYIPLGGSRGSWWRTQWNILVVFVVSGFWHGANWTYMVWGLLNGALYLGRSLRRGNAESRDQHVASGRLLPGASEAVQMVTTFALVCLVWVPFRSSSMTDAWHVWKGILTLAPGPFSFSVGMAWAAIMCLLLVAIEWFGRERAFGIQSIRRLPLGFRWSTYALMGLLILGSVKNTDAFIYFQF